MQFIYINLNSEKNAGNLKNGKKVKLIVDTSWYFQLSLVKKTDEMDWTEVLAIWFSGHISGYFTALHMLTVYDIALAMYPYTWYMYCIYINLLFIWIFPNED